MLPIDIATAETLAFIEQHLVLAQCRVLEVGCGRGHVAQAMAQRGADVIALDSSKEAIESATTMGVRAIEADFLSWEEPKETYDAVIFTRSLHHISPLSEAVSVAHRLLRSSGLLLLEDFAAQTIDEKTLAWLRMQYHELEPAIRQETADGHRHALPVGSLAEWNTHHFEKHQVAHSTAMLNAIGMTFTVTLIAGVPYLYRYLIDRIAATPAAAQVLSQILEAEAASIQAKTILPIGWRLVARR